MKTMVKLATVNKSQATLVVVCIIISSLLESEPLQTPSLDEICWTDGTN